jgi:hypothetical protein
MPIYTPEVGSIGHYTSAATLITILTRTELWFGDLECLSDKGGRNYPPDLYRRLADQMLMDPAPDPNGHRAIFAQNIKKKAKPFVADQYVCRFSKHIDSYHHWLNFAHATPACIIFRSAEIAAAVQAATGQAQPNSFWAGDVDYASEAAFQQRLDQRLAMFLASTQNIPPNVGGNPLYALENITDNISFHLQEAGIAQHVHPTLSQDQEYRIALRKPPNPAFSWDRPPNDVGTYLHFVPRPTFIRPTVVVHLGAGFKDLIRGVVIGPGPETDLAVEKAGMMLGALGYRWQGNPVPVYQSAVAYRWW